MPTTCQRQQERWSRFDHPAEFQRGEESLERSNSMLDRIRLFIWRLGHCEYGEVAVLFLILAAAPGLAAALLTRFAA